MVGFNVTAKVTVLQTYNYKPVTLHFEPYHKTKKWFAQARNLRYKIMYRKICIVAFVILFMTSFRFSV